MNPFYLLKKIKVKMKKKNASILSMAIFHFSQFKLTEKYGFVCAYVVESCSTFYQTGCPFYEDVELSDEEMERTFSQENFEEAKV